MFVLNEEQKQVKKMVSQLAATKMAPNVRAEEENGEFPRESLSLLAEQGLMGLILPPPFGGTGADTY